MSRILLYLALLFSVLISYGAKGQSTKSDTSAIAFELSCQPGVLWSGYRITAPNSDARFVTKDWIPLTKIDIDCYVTKMFYIYPIDSRDSRKKVTKPKKGNNE